MASASRSSSRTAPARAAISPPTCSRNRAPDGYTILQTVNGIAISPSLYKTLPFDAHKDFIAVTQLVRSQLILVAKPSSKPTTSPS